MQRKTRIYLFTGLVITALIIVFTFISLYHGVGDRRDQSIVILQGAGASFQYPQISQWASIFNERYGVTITYQSVGSGAGQRMFLVDGVVHFAASDPPLSRTQYENYKGRVLQVPWLMGAVVVVYNLPGIDTPLNLTGEVIAKIYRGDITYWNDPAIAELNPAIAHRLPAEPIITIFRSDSSGTTEVFTLFLYKSAPSIWPRELVGKTIDPPTARMGRGIGGKGNEGVTALIKQTPYSIGYVEFSYALEQGLSYAAVMNKAGKFILPSESTIRNAATGVDIPGSPLDDFSRLFEDVVYSPHEEAYPIATFAYGLFWSRYEDPAIRRAIVLFLRWIADEGYNHMVRGYVKPPSEVINLLREAANIIETGATG